MGISKVAAEDTWDGQVAGDEKSHAAYQVSHSDH
jgi:hypothetical protein